MKVTMVIPSYWGRTKREGWKEGDAVYDHPTPLDESGTLSRVLGSISLLENKYFDLVVLGVSAASDIQEGVERKVSSIVKNAGVEVRTHFFSHSHLAGVHHFLRERNLDQFIPFLQLRGYSNIRNLCLFSAHLSGSEVAVLIDDDEIFEDPRFMDKALQFIGTEVKRKRVLAVAGYYLNPDADYLLNKEILPWMTYWNKIDCMNRAFRKFIGGEPRLKETPFVFGGNMVVHRDLFTVIPFDSSVPRGEDIDFLINARMFGFKFYLDNKLSIKHDPPPKAHPAWQRVREDIYRFIFEKGKLEAQEMIPGLIEVKAEDLDPYPGEFLKKDLEERIFRSNIMLALDYLRQGDEKGASECLRNIYLAKTEAVPRENPFHNLLDLQKTWRDLMAHFSSEEVTQELRARIGMEK